MAQLTMEKFDCEGDAGSVCVRWERWKRSLNLYLEAAGVVTSVKKRASLLHWGGAELQEIFYNIPGANVTTEENDDVFEVAIKTLDDYFSPKQSKRFERHVFRQMKQEGNEKFEKFVVRLRQQAIKCRFSDIEDHLVDQITEKCLSEDLRKKILKSGDKMNLNDIIAEANALETVNRQLEDFGKKQRDTQDINRIENKEKQPRNKKGCYRCGSWNHLAFSDTCLAKGKECHKCGKTGHYQRMCTTTLKRKRTDQPEEQTLNAKRSKKSRKVSREVRHINEEDTNDSEKDDISYVFNVDGDDTVTCLIGNTKVDMLIDSGCKHNLITDKTWEEMKTNQVRVTNQIPEPKKTFLAYGSTTPLKLIGSFQSDITLAGNKENTTFYVVKGGTRNLLGKKTAMDLGVLKVGLGVNNIGSEACPKFKDILIQIPIDETVKPIAQPYRRIPIPLEEKVERKINELLSKDIIEKVEGASDWISPIVPILKEDNDVRICVDMRAANTAIKRENHPLPTMDQLLPKIRNATVFSKLDIKDAFHQLEIHPDSREITTFITQKGLFRYKRLMFGISCAPEIFQKTLERLLIGCDGVVNFIDDILVFGKDQQEHDARLNKVLAVLKNNNVVLRKDKCKFNTDTVQFLGHELSEAGIRPLDKYISAIKDFRAPATVTELQSFLGLVTYVGKWIPNMATITEPMKELLRRKSGRNADLRELWGKRQQTAFSQIKAALGDLRNLGYYDKNDKTVIYADASPVGLGAVLVQVGQKGPRVVAYGNKTLTDCERRYCQTEKEALALVWAVEHFHMFLYGKEFELVTDHKPLEVIFGPRSKPCARIERWILRLQSYRYKVVYRPGKNNIADPLSRLCYIYSKQITERGRDYVQQIVEQVRPVAVPLKEIEEVSREDSEIQKVRQGIFEQKWDDAVKTFKVFENELCFYGNILLRSTKIVIPKLLRDKVLAAAHEGHPGIVAMKLRLRSKVWWPRYDKDAEKLVKSCKGCTLVSAPNPPHPLKRRELPLCPWMDIAIDLLGPLPSGDYLFVVIDYFSRYKEIKVCKDITSKEMIRLLREIFSRLGHPISITADNGKQFVSEEFREFCRENDIKLFHSIPYWPQQNGEVERQNRDIIKRLKISQIEKKKDWKESLLDYLTMCNNTPHTVTGKTPAELFFQRKFRDKIPMIDHAEDTHRLYDTDVRDRDKEQKERGKEYADRKRKAKDVDLEPGDKVYVKKASKTNKLCSNFEPTPHTVKARSGGDVEIQNDETGQCLRRNVVHLKRIEGHWQVVNDNKPDDEEKDDDDEEQGTDNENLEEL